MNMPVDSNELFSIYQISPKEQLSGQQYNDAQIKVLHNLRAEKAAALLRLPFMPDNIVKYAQDEAYLTGQLELLDMLLFTPEISTDNDKE